MRIVRAKAMAVRLVAAMLLAVFAWKGMRETIGNSTYHMAQASKLKYSQLAF
ncbi:MAG: hypothetical protein FWC82_00705 [Firmicutes bacterium]|nr:hypothetical protein [Bacillota bacterium]